MGHRWSAVHYTLNMVERILLTGFMGSGKSTIGRLLAKQLGWAFCDLDREIETRTRLSVPEIFAQRGEPHFRDLEAKTLAVLLQRRQTVIALGGGAPEHPPTRALLTADPATAFLYLSADFATLYERCVQQSLRPDAIARPLLASREDAEARHNRRHPLYAALATHTLDTTALNPTQTVAALLKALQLQPRTL